MSTFVAYAERQFEDIDDIPRQVLRIDANNLTLAVSYWGLFRMLFAKDQMAERRKKTELHRTEDTGRSLSGVV